MDSATGRPTPDPNRSETLPESYAIHVTDRRIHVWQYRVDLSNPDGQWRFVEMLDRERSPKLSLGHATLTAPDADGYWIYSRSYGCEIDCE